MPQGSEWKDKVSGKRRTGEGRMCFHHHNKYGQNRVPHQEHLWLWLALTWLWPRIQKNDHSPPWDIDPCAELQGQNYGLTDGLVERHNPQAVALRATIAISEFPKVPSGNEESLEMNYYGLQENMWPVSRFI